MKDLKDYSDEELRKELESRGYQTNNLWHIDDVESKLIQLDIDPEAYSTEDKRDILIWALNNEAVYSAVWDAIEEEISQS